MEADLQQFYGIDYRDRWHPDRRRRLTLRRLYVLLAKEPPIESRVLRIMNDGRPVWALVHHLLDELRLVIEAVNTDPKKHKPKPHPSRPTGKTASNKRRKDTPERRRKLADARRRAQERRARKEAGLL